MLPYRLAFDSPWHLSWLLLLPVLWVLSYRSLSGLGSMRRWLALGLRTVVMALVILALAETQLVRTHDRLTVIYLLDQSLSVPDAQRQEMVDYINASIARHRKEEKRDRAGVVVFGEDAAVEIPPIDEHVPLPATSENQLDRQQSNLAAALKLAQALFPHDSAKRVVVVSDGNETLGDARAQAQALADAGVSIDVVPIHLAARGEVAVEKLTVSNDVRRGQPFDLRVVLNNTTDGEQGGAVRGRLRIVRRTGERETTMAEQEVELPPGKRVFSIRQQIDQPDFYTYEARFVPDNPADDAMPQNNAASTFTHVRGRGHVLLIEDWEHRGQFDLLVDRLRGENLEVTVMPSDQLFHSLADLQRYDTVVLANVPRSSGEQVDQISHFSDEQIEMLARNTQQMGSGLIMLGGPNSFGAGGWANTELEEAMPVDFHVKDPKVVPVGALAMVMHASEMPQGNYWQKVVAREALRALGGHDYCGVIHFDGTGDRWLWRHPTGFARVGDLRDQMLARLDRMAPGDMPDFEPSMRMALASFVKLPDAAVKHMIIISDGDPSPPRDNTLAGFKQAGVRVTTVSIGSHGILGSNVMQRIASVTGGKYYVVKDAKALPRIYQREARRIARPLVYEDKSGMRPQVKFPHEMMKGLADEPLPPITGYVLTSVKKNPLVEVSLLSPRPKGDENATLLASWTYGLGKAVAFTTDAGARWASDWTGWEDYDKFFSQMVRWSMRPTDDAGNFSLASSVEEGQGTVVITALDKDDEFLNFLAMQGSVLGPDMKPRDLKIRQTAPGRYVGQFDADQSGSYFVTINPGSGSAPLRTGVDVPYSDEFRDHETNLALLDALASVVPQGGEPGAVIDVQEDALPQGQTRLESLLQVDPFRRDMEKSTSHQDVWPLLVLIAACVFLADVFNRRVQLDLSWLPPMLAAARDKVLRREPAPAEDVTMSRLRSSKAAVADQLEEKRRAVRFEPSTTESADPEPLQTAAATPQAEKPRPPKQQPIAPEKAEESYTERLLKAKRRARDDRK